MRKIDQTILADDPKRQGNCLAACVATWLDRPLDEVPHFAEYAPERKDSWWDLLIGYMAGHGYWPIELTDVGAGMPDERLFVMGMSARGVCHQVIYRNGHLWHDPHPSRAGVLDVREVIAWRPVRHDHEPTCDPTPCFDCGTPATLCEHDRCPDCCDRHWEPDPDLEHKTRLEDRTR